MKTIKLRFLFVALLALLFFSPSIARAQEGKYLDKKTVVQNLVNEATELINTKGNDAIDMIEDKDGKFNTKDTYVFVTSGTGSDLVNPAFKDVEGLPPEVYTDAAMRQAQETIVTAVKDTDTAWVEYSWPKPGQTNVSKKISYLKKIIVNGKTRIVGAGFYPEE